jgi:hypothetical protein
MMEKHGWYAHFVLAEDESGVADIHTHGIEQTFGQPDLQVTLPLPTSEAKVILRLFHNVVDYIKQGVELRNGVYLDRVVSGMKVKLVAAEEGGRPILRMILPDAQGKLEPDEMSEDFARQYERLFDNDV